MQKQRNMFQTNKEKNPIETDNEKVVIYLIKILTVIKMLNEVRTMHKVSVHLKSVQFY